MNKTMKIILGVVAVVVVGGGIGGYLLFSNLEGIIQAAIEKFGSQATQTTVTVNQVKLDLGSGKGGIYGLKMTNPKGYDTPKAIELGEASVTIDTGSITGDTVVIKEVVIGKPDVTYEFGGDAGSNLQSIQKNVEAFTGGGGGSSSGGGSTKKLIIENLYVRDGTVNISAAGLGGKQLTTPLPTIHLTDIGKESGGAGPGEVISEVLGAIASASTSAVSAIDIEGISKAAEGAAQAAGDAAKSAGESLGKAGEGVGNTLKGLFGK